VMSIEATPRVYGAGCSERFRVIAHISIGVKNIDRIKHFYDAALRPLGYKCPRGARTSVGYGFGVDSVFFSGYYPLSTRFAAPSAAAVDAFHTAALTLADSRDTPLITMPLLIERIVDRAKGDGWRIPTITVESEDYVCLVALAVIIHAGTTGRLIIALIPGRRRHRIWTGSTASRSLGQRVYKVSSAHLPSRRAS